MAKYRLLLILLAIWFVFLFNLERPDFGNLGNIDLDSFVYVLSAAAAVSVLALPDLGRRAELMYIPSLILYGVGKALFGRTDPEYLSIPIVITEIVVLLITIAVARALTLATVNIEKAIENVLLAPNKSNIYSEADGEERINNELFRARRFDRPVGFIALRIEWLEGMKENPFDRFNLEAAFQRRYLKVRIAQVAEATIYRSDVIAWSNDNLVICLPETNRDQTIKLARQIHALLRIRLGISIAVGISTFPDDGLIFRDLLDTALLNPIEFDEKDEPGSGPPSRSDLPVQRKKQPLTAESKPGITAFKSIGKFFEMLPIDFTVSANDNSLEIPNDPDFWVNELPYQSASSRLFYRIIKRVIDLGIVIVSLPVSLPLFVLISFAVFLDGGLPIIFVQKRTGLGGRRFKMFKFRTMVPDAEEQLQAMARNGLVKLGDEGKLSEPLKLENDPRVTRIGRFLRKSSLDELPQIFNVLLGDMSLVGPRPTSWGLGSYSLLHTERLTVRPGITGLWQIGARGNTNFDDWLEWDMLYIDKVSLTLDLQILLRTVGQVVKRRGAY